MQPGGRVVEDTNLSVWRCDQRRQGSATRGAAAAQLGWSWGRHRGDPDDTLPSHADPGDGQASHSQLTDRPDLSALTAHGGLTQPCLGPLPNLEEAGLGASPRAPRSGLSALPRPTQIMQLLMRGNRQRTQEPTAANQTSSRLPRRAPGGCAPAQPGQGRPAGGAAGPSLHDRPGWL